MCSGETGIRHEPPEDWTVGKLGAAHQGRTAVLPLEPHQEDRESGYPGDAERAGAVRQPDHSSRKPGQPREP